VTALDSFLDKRPVAERSEQGDDGRRALRKGARRTYCSATPRQATCLRGRGGITLGSFAKATRLRRPLSARPREYNSEKKEDADRLRSYRRQCSMLDELRPSVTPFQAPAALVTLLTEAEGLLAELGGYEQERRALREQAAKCERRLRLEQSRIASGHRWPEMRSVGTKSRTLLRKFWIVLSEMDLVDNIRRELRRFEDEYIDEIDSSKTGWIGGFLTQLVTILRDACSICVEPEPATPAALNPEKRKRGRPVIIPDERKAKALDPYRRGDDPVEIARILYDKPKPTSDEKSNIDQIIRHYARKQGLPDPAQVRRTNRQGRA
jgi:hypothetical protein